MRTMAYTKLRSYKKVKETNRAILTMNTNLVFSRLLYGEDNESSNCTMCLPYIFPSSVDKSDFRLFFVSALATDRTKQCKQCNNQTLWNTTMKHASGFQMKIRENGRENARLINCRITLVLATPARE